MNKYAYTIIKLVSNESTMRLLCISDLMPKIYKLIEDARDEWNNLEDPGTIWVYDNDINEYVYDYLCNHNAGVVRTREATYVL